MRTSFGERVRRERDTNGAGRMSLKAGWYPQDDGRERYWDGEKWTDAFRRAPEPEPSDDAPEAKPAPDKEPVGRVWTFVGVGIFIALALMVSRCGGGDEDRGPDEYDTQATCKELVRGVLKNPSTADFMNEQQNATGASGTVVAENSLGGKVTSTYRCTLSGGIVRLVEGP